MGHFLEPLLHDLGERFRFLEEELGQMAVPPEAEACRSRIHRLVARAKDRVEIVLQDPDISRPEFAKNFYHTYKRLSELAQAIDEGPLFALSRFRDQDRFLTAVVVEACREFRYPDQAPICAAMSSQYYCTMTDMDLVLVPHGESSHLLGWADLYHELAHFIVARNEASLVQPLRALVASHFGKAIEHAERSGASVGAIEELKAFQNLWLGDWVVEFACDLFATFATGPSFARSNLRLCARMSTDVFGTVRTHPADAARTGIILEMLSLVGETGERELIEDRWKELLGTIGATEPQSFGSAYPQTLLRELAGEAKASFEGLGLKGYARGEKGIADLLNDAWKHFQSQPETFAAWEKSQIEAFRRRLGLSK
jgi:hypothetical protein